MENLFMSMTMVGNLLAALSALIAAWFWFLSSRTSVPDNLIGVAAGPSITIVSANPLLLQAQKSGRLNAIAAGFSAAAAFIAAIPPICDAVAFVHAMIS
jgi:steroid 5-alpha reductase family enzyme